MSAKLLKSLAKGKCRVQNAITGEVVIYWPGEKVLDSLVIRSGQDVNLMSYASVDQLRRSPNLKSLVNAGHLRVL